MKAALIFLFFLITIGVLLILYGTYQLFRNEKVFSIRTGWIANNKFELFFKYSYDDMFEPCRSNWYGLKWPNEKDYQ